MQAARTMLIVDDTRLARMMIRGFVAQTYPDWTILEAQDGAAALAQVDARSDAEPIDVMTIDLNMPGMDGLTLATTLRQKYPNAHIALVTANIQDRVQRRVQDAGLGFIPKPITEDKILTFLAHAEPDHA